LLTHAHLDHVGGTLELARNLKLPIIGPQEEDAFWLDLLPEQARMFGFPPAEAFRPDQWLHDGDVVDLGSLRLR
jgi:hydroxyacylglutathione hydrolase